MAKAFEMLIWHLPGRVNGNRCTGRATAFFVVWGSKFSLQGILATVVRRSVLAPVKWRSAHQYLVWFEHKLLKMVQCYKNYNGWLSGLILTNLQSSYDICMHSHPSHQRVTYSNIYSKIIVSKIAYNATKFVFLTSSYDYHVLIALSMGRGRT